MNENNVTFHLGFAERRGFGKWRRRIINDKFIIVAQGKGGEVAVAK